MTLYRVQLGSAAEGHGNVSEWYGFLAGFSNLTFQRRYLRLRREEEMQSSAGLHHVCGHIQKLCSEPHTTLLFSFEQSRLPLGPVIDTLLNTWKKKTVNGVSLPARQITGEKTTTPLSWGKATHSTSFHLFAVTQKSKATPAIHFPQLFKDTLTNFMLPFFFSLADLIIWWKPS